MKRIRKVKRLNPARTKGQNEVLVMHVLEQLSQGKFLKEIASNYDLRIGTLTNMLKRYRERHGFKNMYHMLTIYVILRERKLKKEPVKKAPFKFNYNTFKDAAAYPVADHLEQDRSAKV